MPGNGGVTWAMATFQDLANSLEEQKIGSFIIPTDEGFGSGDTIVLEIFNNEGKRAGAYSFVDQDNCETYELAKTGWYPLKKMQDWEATDDDLSDDVILPFGCGVIITSGEDDSSLTFAGQVVGEKTYKIWGDGGVTWTGNSTPVNLTLKDFAIPTDEGFGSGDTIVLEIFNDEGKREGSYSFVDADNCETYELTNPGWYPLKKMQDWEATDDDLSNDVEIPSGKMVIITSGESDTTLTIPDPMKVTPPAAK